MGPKISTHALKLPVEPESGIIRVPHLFIPRSYQQRAMAYIDGGGKRAVCVWHRRAGKNIAWLNQIIKQMVTLPFCATFLYIFPKLTQGRRDLWDAKSSPLSGGIPFRAHFPPQLVMEASETEMQVMLKPMPHQKPMPISTGRGRQKLVGSIFQVMGTDKDSIENLRGINSYGNVLDEFQDQNPEAWTNIIEPVLAENGGWAAFTFTPKGENHGKDIYDQARNSPSWFAELLTIDQTKRDAEGESGLPVITQEYIEELRARGTAEEIIQQEYYCSFKGYLRGTIYGDVLAQATKDGRIGRVPWISSKPVGLMWDIGRTDGTAIWFYQVHGSEIRFIDYYANLGGKGADFYAKVCREKPYMYGKIMLPHDAAVTGFSAIESTEELLKKTLCRHVVVVKNEPGARQRGIDATRRMFSRFYFDEHNCSAAPSPGMVSGLTGLGNYHREWNEEYRDYSGQPVHDANSHPADALRIGMMGWQEGLDFSEEATKPLVIETAFDLHTYRQRIPTHKEGRPQWQG